MRLEATPSVTKMSSLIYKSLARPNISSFLRVACQISRIVLGDRFIVIVHLNRDNTIVARRLSETGVGNVAQYMHDTV